MNGGALTIEYPQLRLPHKPCGVDCNSQLIVGQLHPKEGNEVNNLNARLARLESKQPEPTTGVLLLPCAGTEDPVAVRVEWDQFIATGKTSGPVVLIPADEPDADQLSGKRLHTRINFVLDANWYRNWDRLHPGTEPPPPEDGGWLGFDADWNCVIDRERSWDTPENS